MEPWISSKPDGLISTTRRSYPVLQSKYTTIAKDLDRDNLKCTENQHVAFLKTYKTGSETISGILRRFALLRNLSSAISVGPGGKNCNFEVSCLLCANTVWYCSIDNLKDTKNSWYSCLKTYWLINILLRILMSLTQYFRTFIWCHER